MKIFHLPIEPYETRYTKDWVEQFEDEFTEYGVEFKTIFGEKTVSTLKQGTVLDCCGTNYYKFTQLAKLITEINEGNVHDGDVIFISDLWFPGIESLFYIRNISKIDFKIYGILHAGTWDENDFTYLNGMRVWGKHLEACWFTEVDGIFVATQYHKQLILDSIIGNTEVADIYDDIENKIYVTGIPFYAKDVHKYATKKENIVVFPHRNAEEKQPHLFKLLTSMIKEFMPDFQCINTFDVCKTRQDYFELLGKSKYMVSFAKQETFGYSTVEAMALQCCVIVPDKLSYVETVPPQHRYIYNEVDLISNVSTVFDMIQHFETNHPAEYNYYSYLCKWSMSVYNMLEIITQNRGR